MMMLPLSSLACTRDYIEMTGLRSYQWWSPGQHARPSNQQQPQPTRPPRNRKFKHTVNFDFRSIITFNLNMMKNILLDEITYYQLRRRPFLKFLFPIFLKIYILTVDSPTIPHLKYTTFLALNEQIYVVFRKDVFDLKNMATEDPEFKTCWGENIKTGIARFATR